MNVANDKLWLRISFGIFLLSFCVLVVFVLNQDATKLQVEPLTNTLIANESSRYFTSGIVQFVTTQDNTQYITLETFCTVSGKYDLFFYDDEDIQIGDFITVEGNVESFNGKKQLAITKIET